ncbi:hypothetical protein GN316_20160 [Xylophilus sp. Kf1]|nr:hypothetical protein [Xylophilus sp. Kf1]
MDTPLADPCPSDSPGASIHAVQTIASAPPPETPARGFRAAGSGRHRYRMNRST